MDEIKSRPKLVLGSSSPRRRDLLDAVGLTYSVLKPETPEVPMPGELPEAYTRRNAEEKAAWVVDRLSASERTPAGLLVISADTIVVLDDRILEKPSDPDHAKTMLRGLSGRWHTVISGVTLQSAFGPSPHRQTFAVHTRVLIKSLSDAEIDSYVRTGEPLDKAGAYAAQGIGSYMVERIEGSYANVVGLPIAEVVQALEQSFGYTIWG